MSWLFPERLDTTKANFFYRLLLQSHIKRYEFASRRVKNLKVLDAACGDGYGSYILSKSAKRVVGIDISKKTIELSKRRIKARNVAFYHCDATSLDFPNSSFEAVVSLETIEYLSLKDTKKFLSEIKRILRLSGKLIISTPEKQNVSLGKSPLNPHHLQEYSLKEFKSLLSKYFTVTNVYGQDYAAKYQLDLFKALATGPLTKPMQIAWRIYQKLHFFPGKISKPRGNKIPWVNIIEAYNSSRQFWWR